MVWLLCGVIPWRSILWLLGVWRDKANCIGFCVWCNLCCFWLFWRKLFLIWQVLRLLLRRVRWYICRYRIPFLHRFFRWLLLLLLSSLIRVKQGNRTLNRLVCIRRNTFFDGKLICACWVILSRCRRRICLNEKFFRLDGWARTK